MKINLQSLKLMSVGAVVAVAAFGTACSSDDKSTEVSTTTPSPQGGNTQVGGPTPIVETTVETPAPDVNLGATSSGRAR